MNNINQWLKILLSNFLVMQSCYSNVEQKDLDFKVRAENDHMYFSLISNKDGLCVLEPDLFLSLIFKIKTKDDYLDLSFIPRAVGYTPKIRKLDENDLFGVRVKLSDIQKFFDLTPGDIIKIIYMSPPYGFDSGDCWAGELSVKTVWPPAK